MKNFLQKSLLIGLVWLASLVAMTAQCPMCRATLETNLANGGKAGTMMNAGILYMLILPYLLVGGIGVWWWRNRKKES